MKWNLVWKPTLGWRMRRAEKPKLLTSDSTLRLPFWRLHGYPRMSIFISLTQRHFRVWFVVAEHVSTCVSLSIVIFSAFATLSLPQSSSPSTLSLMTCQSAQQRLELITTLGLNMWNVNYENLLANFMAKIIFPAVVILLGCACRERALHEMPTMHKRFVSLVRSSEMSRKAAYNSESSWNCCSDSSGCNR
jgi:hypothetical protein